MGLFCLVLHTHLPYVRRNGVWPAGEDFFHQAAVESYLPLLGVFRELAEEGVQDACTVGLSPMVAHQMQDPHMRRELELYLGGYELRAWRQVANYEGVFRDEFRRLAGFYARFAREQGERLDGVAGIADGFSELERAGTLEILGGPATHPYLPLMREPPLAAAQVRIGVGEHGRIVGRAPSGMWLPECAYAPAAGIEAMLEDNGVSHVVVDGPTMLRSAGPGSTFAPRRIGSSNVAAFARNLDVTYRVWSPTGGYPTNRWYRDFFHYDLEGGFKNWRVTSVRKPLERKRPYEPEAAVARAHADAEDFATVVARALERQERQEGASGVVVAAFDTELFGHWWFEGPTFLRHLLRILPERGVQPATLRSALASLPEPAPVALEAGSWGFRKDDRSWVDERTEGMWRSLGEVETETVRLLEKHADADERRSPLLAQLLREALLLQASDWPFMVIRGRNAEYARERFAEHERRWSNCAEQLAGPAPDPALADALFEIDNVLPDLDPFAVLR